VKFLKRIGNTLKKFHFAKNSAMRPQSILLGDGMPIALFRLAFTEASLLNLTLL